MPTQTSKISRDQAISRVVVWGLLFALALFYMGQVLTPYIALATFSYALLVIGLFYRKRKKIHSSFMLAGIGLDLSLVLILEIQRSAINTAAAFSLSAVQQSHIGFSLAATLLYFPTVYLGIQRYRAPSPDQKQRWWHLRVGIIAFIFRTLGFITMFSMLKHVKGV